MFSTFLGEDALKEQVAHSLRCAISNAVVGTIDKMKSNKRGT